MEEFENIQLIPGETLGAALAKAEASRQEKIAQLRGNKNSSLSNQTDTAPEPKPDLSLRTQLEKLGVDRLRDHQTGEWMESFGDALKRWDSEKIGETKQQGTEVPSTEAQSLPDSPAPDWLGNVDPSLYSSRQTGAIKTVPLQQEPSLKPKEPVSIPDLFSDENWDK